jgi:fumarate reductase flavoprotein subunit
MAGSRAVDWLAQRGAEYLPGRFWLAPTRGRQPGISWQGWGPDLLLQRLTESLLQQGGQLVLGAHADRLVESSGRIKGMRATLRGETVTYESRSVLLADGGFHGSPAMIGRFISPRPETLVLRNSLASQGAGMLMAEAVGANLVGTRYFYGHLLSRDALKNGRLWPYPTMDLIAAASLVVNGRGERFADEGKGGIYLANHIAWSDNPLEYWAIVDDDVWSRGIARRLEGDGSNPDSPNPDVIDNGGTVLKAESIEDLAAKSGLPAKALASTIDAYNASLANGRLDQLQPTRTNETGSARPISTPPFHGIPLAVGITKTMGGPAVDEHCRVLRKDGSVIEGLYVIGSAIGGLEGGPSVGYFGGLSQALIGGLLAAEHVASLRKDLS